MRPRGRARFAKVWRQAFATMLWFIALLAAGAAPSSNATPTRVISLSPNITESVFALGRGDCLCGVSDFCNYPPEALAKPRCGGWANPNYEIMASLRPELVLLLGRHEKVAAFCRDRAIPFVHLEMNSIATIKESLAALGKTLGAQDEATSLCRQIDEDLAALRSTAPESRRPKVFISLNRRQGSLGELFTVGKGTFLDEILALVGGRNVFGDVANPYPQASKEALIARQPDIIIEMLPGARLDGEKRRAFEADWAGLASIPAVRDGRIRFVTEDYVLIAGPRVARIAAIMKQAIATDATR